MTDYTPDTNAVRKVYSAAPIVTDANRASDAAIKHASAAFDRWLDATIRAAQAEAWATGMQQAIECADDTTDRFGNLYRLDWMNRMEFEQERNPYKEAADV